MSEPTNRERVQALLDWRRGQPFTMSHDMLDGVSALRRLQRGESLLVSRERLESIVEDLTELERLKGTP